MEQFARAADLYASIATDFPQSKHASAAMVAAGKNYCLAGNHARTGEVLAGVLQAGGAAAVEAAHWASRSLLALGQPGEAFQVAEAGLAAAEFPVCRGVDDGPGRRLYEQPARAANRSIAMPRLPPSIPRTPWLLRALHGRFRGPRGGPHELAAIRRPVPRGLSGSMGLPTTRGGGGPPARARRAKASGCIAALWSSTPITLISSCGGARRGSPDAEKHAEAIESIAPILGEIRDKNLLAEAETMAGQSALAAGQSDAAIKHLEASLAAAPAWRGADQSLLLLAEAERGQGNDEKAAAALERLFAESPKSSLLDKAHYRFGEIKFAKGDYAAAEQEFRWVLEHAEGSPLVPHALHQLACAQLNDKRPAEAEATASQLLSRFADHPSGAEARYFRGLARQQMAKYAPAAEDLTAAVGGQLPAALRPDALYVLGLCQIGLEQNAEAAKTLAGLLSESPDYAGADNARYQLAWALLLAERRKEAIEQFARLAKDRPRALHGP